MYAIVEHGEKQYKVKEGDIIAIEKVDKKTGEKIELNPIFLENNGVYEAGVTLKKAKVTGEVIGISHGPKVVIYKYKKRKNYNKKTGHRQDYSEIKITQIAVG